MIESKTYKSFAKKLYSKMPGMYPLSAQIELTYRCNLKCIHCYCIGCEKQEELITAEWKNIIDQLHAAGTIYLTITGGEPFLREDLLDIYDYAKKKGFLITLFTNGILLDDRIIDYLAKEPPYSIEITLNGITKETYEAISGVKGSFEKATQNIEKIAKKKLSLSLKAVGLKQNKDEIRDIKRFTEKLCGKKKFKFDSFITPRLDCNTTPCRHRLSAEEILKIEESNPDMRKQREKQFENHKSLQRESEYKYHCNSWFKQFYVTPSGRLRFCHMTDKYSYDLRRTSLEKGFYEGFPPILEEKFISDSKCISCDLREHCHYCPVRAYLETGDEEGVVPYYCELARMTKERVKSWKP